MRVQIWLTHLFAVFKATTHQSFIITLSSYYYLPLSTVSCITLTVCVVKAARCTSRPIADDPLCRPDPRGRQVGSSSSGQT